MDNINLNRENGQKLWAADWNKLISTINLIIDAVNNQNNLSGITKLSQLVNDSGFITEEDISGKVNKNELALVASTGNYNDLINKPTYTTGPQGPEGKSAYQIAVANGFVGTQQLWLDSLKGEEGQPGLDGHIGIDGKSAYELYVESVPSGYTPLTLLLWLESLQGLDGDPGQDGNNGKSAYELAVELGYEGTLELWLLSLHGQDGLNGSNGSNGVNGQDGITPHIDSTSKHWMIGSTDTNIVAEGLDGTNGTDGVTPHIDSTTGNWFIGNTDTGVHAQGPAGQDGNVAGQVQADWNQSDNSLVDYIKNKPSLSTVATSGSYLDLTDKPTTNTNGHDYVEIGGIKWATKNIGANTETDIGLYFLWGDIQGYSASLVGTTEGKKAFELEDYKFWNGSDPRDGYYCGEDFSKYNPTDQKSSLDLEDDAAHMNWGGSWRMPTKQEYLILLNSTTSVSVVNYNNSGINGTLFTDKTDSSKTLFFPNSGLCYDGEIHTSSIGFYYMNSCYVSGGCLAYTGADRTHFDGTSSPSTITERNDGLVIRPVLESKEFSNVAFTGDYNDLLNLPTIPIVPELSTVAISGNYNDLLYKPELFNANNHECVEIGGLLWATCNVGALNPYDTGLYFLWGDTQGYTTLLIGNGEDYKYFNKDDYKYYNNGSYTKYNNTDNKKILDDLDDPVLVNWGGDWRLPTPDEIKILGDATTHSWTSNYENSGISGLILTDKKDNSKKLFFPASGKASAGQQVSLQLAIYMSNSLGSSNYVMGILYDNLSFYGVDNRHSAGIRYEGILARGVIGKSLKPFSTVAFTGDYNDLINKPTIPTTVSDLTNDMNYIYPNTNKARFVDLGLPSGTLWYDSGDLVSTLKNYDDDSIQAWIDGGYYQYGFDRLKGSLSNHPLNYHTEACSSDHVDTNTRTLKHSYDVSRARLGGSWSLPTVELYQELIKYCSISTPSLYGSGIATSYTVKFTGPNGNYIMFVLSGMYEYDGTNFILQDKGTVGYYLSSSYNSINSSTNRIQNIPVLKISSSGAVISNGYDYANAIMSATAVMIPNYVTQQLLIQADWNLENDTALDYIKNKPTITNGTNGKSAYLSYVDTTSDNPVLTEQQWVASLQGTNGTNGTNGTDGVTPHIDPTSKHWMIGSTDTGILAEGLNGTNGTNGTDGITPHIDQTTGNWFIGSTDTGVHALGPAGQGGSSSGVLSDWNESDNTSLAYIANKPTIPTVPSNETATSGGSTLSVVTTGDKYNWNNKANVWQGTQAQYDALSPNYDSNTIYIITAS